MLMIVGPDRCSECGAELRLSPASCPLCGATPVTSQPNKPPPDPARYQANVRALKEKLKQLRQEDAEAV